MVILSAFDSCALACQSARSISCPNPAGSLCSLPTVRPLANLKRSHVEAANDVRLGSIATGLPDSMRSALPPQSRRAGDRRIRREGPVASFCLPPTASGLARTTDIFASSLHVSNEPIPTYAPQQWRLIRSPRRPAVASSLVPRCRAPSRFSDL